MINRIVNIVLIYVLGVFLEFKMINNSNNKIYPENWNTNHERNHLILLIIRRFV